MFFFMLVSFSEEHGFVNWSWYESNTLLPQTECCIGRLFVSQTVIAFSGVNWCVSGLSVTVQPHSSLIKSSFLAQVNDRI